MFSHGESPSVCISTASIITWLKDQPDDPTKYEGGCLDWHLSPTGNRKRTLLDEVTQTSRSSMKRPRLREINLNEMGDPEKSTQPATPRNFKRKRSSNEELTTLPIDDDAPSHDLPLTPNQRNRASIITLFDEDPTPRASTIVGNTLPDIAHSGTAGWDRHSELSSTSTQSPRTRSLSPTKRLGDFQLSNIQVELKDLGTPGYPTPPAARGLLRDIRHIGKGVGVIPRVYLERMRAWNEDDPIDDFNLESVEANPTNHDRHPSPSADTDIFWYEVLKLHRAAQECQNESSSEPTWNAEVHSRLFRLALEPTRTTSEVWYQNVTVDQIRDVSLLPTIPSSVTRAATRMQSKMVDYVLLLEPDAGMHPKIIRLLNEGLLLTDRSSINQISSEGLRFKPIAVSVETKRAAIHEDVAHVQLSVWVSAQFAKLQQLVSSSTQQPSATPVPELPVLPLIVVQGHVWKLLVACVTPSSLSLSSTNTNTSSPLSIVILRDATLGTTASVLGCFTLIASLRRLMRWVNEDFHKWWKEVLGDGGSQE